MDICITKNLIIIQSFKMRFFLSEKYILRSKFFQLVLKLYLDTLQSTNDGMYDVLVNAFQGQDMSRQIPCLLASVSSMSLDEALRLHVSSPTSLSRHDLIDFVERFYNFWRRLNRIATFQTIKRTPRSNAKAMIQEMDYFTNLVLNFYRGILSKLDPYSHSVYRQLISGVNVGISRYVPKKNKLVGYDGLKGIPFIDTVVIQPPMITYPTKTTRSGMFQDLKHNYAQNVILDPSQWSCYPAKIGEYLAFVYFHHDYMVLGMALANLFELATTDEVRDKKPKIIYLFGVSDNLPEPQLGYYYDARHDLMVGYASKQPKIDYFGYMKKMLLTQYNLLQLKQGHLPIHGAMVHVVLQNNTRANIIIVGDSGAGKSESLDAFRSLASGYLKSFKIIFDDMGSLKFQAGKVIATGTEIGAFVRLDDLEEGYAFNEIDRAIFMNPDKINARMVMPVTKYQDIMLGYEVDYIFYANNYDSPPAKVRLFGDPLAAQEVFIAGKRMAKGTTSEQGIVQSFFANPFGPAQEEAISRELIQKYFLMMFEQGVKVGELFTQLGVSGFEKKGPAASAKAMLDLIVRLQSQ